MNKNINLLNLLCFIFKVLFYAIKEKEDKKKRYIEKKLPGHWTKLLTANY